MTETFFYFKLFYSIDFMAIRNLERVLQYLEENAEDELELLESTGPEYFSTPELWKLRGQWEVKNRLFRDFQGFLIRLAAFSPVWIAVWGLCSLIGWSYPALLFLFMFPVTFLAFFAGLYYLRKVFKGKGHLDNTGEMIVRELRRRANQS